MIGCRCYEVQSRHASAIQLAYHGNQEAESDRDHVSCTMQCTDVGLMRHCAHVSTLRDKGHNDGVFDYAPMERFVEAEGT